MQYCSSESLQTIWPLIQSSGWTPRERTQCRKRTTSYLFNILEEKESPEMAVALWSWASSSCLPWMSVHGSRSHPWSHTTSMAWCFTCWETGSDYRETVKSNIVFFFSFLTSLVKKRAASSFKAAFSAVCIQIQGVYIFQFKRTLWNFSPKHQTFFQNQKQQRASVVK